MLDRTRVTLPAAGDRIPGAYDRAPTHERMIAEKDVAVSMRDGANLSVDIYRPDSAQKFPVLLAFSIYNKDLQGPDVAASLPPQPAWSSLWTGPWKQATRASLSHAAMFTSLARRAELANPMAAEGASGTATT